MARKPRTAAEREKFLDGIKDEIDTIKDRVPLARHQKLAAKDLIEYLELHYL